MKITTNKDFIIDNVKKIILVFKDDKEITLEHIANYDLHLDNIDMTYVRFTNMFVNGEIINRFSDTKLNKIKLIHIEVDTISNWETMKKEQNMIDIPCYMEIGKLQFNGDVNGIGDMYIELEGLVR